MLGRTIASASAAQMAPFVTASQGFVTNGKAVLEFEKACTAGNVIMLVEGDKRVVTFALHGRVQGACHIPGDRPLYVRSNPGGHGLGSRKTEETDAGGCSQGDVGISEWCSH